MWIAVICVVSLPGCRSNSGPNSALDAVVTAQTSTELVAKPVPKQALESPIASLVSIPGGPFVMGDAKGDANEAPRTVTVSPFRIMRYEVTNHQFEQFVAHTEYVTDVEKRGLGFVWRNRRWQRIAGADWRHPHGPETSIAGQGGHPVVQVSAQDAAAFCGYYGLRLPSEEEWEFAARGTDGRRYTWGSEPPPPGNAERGNFGTRECCDSDGSDGFVKIAPVAQYPKGASPYGLLDLAGNVWEWTSSPFPGRADMVALRGGGWGNSLYCLRASYRHANPPNRGLDMVGFRCAADPS